MNKDNTMVDDFVEYLDKVIKYSNDDIFADDTADIQIKLLVQVKEKYLQLKSQPSVDSVVSDEEIANAMKVLIKALGVDKTEGSYYYSWQANIAMAFKDEFDKQNDHANFTQWLFLQNGLHEIANQAAKNFLDLLTK